MAQRIIEDRADGLPTGASNSSALDTKYLQARTERCHEAEQTLADPAMGLDNASRSGGAKGHAPGAKTRAVQRGRALALPLPSGGGWIQGDMLGDWQRLGLVVTTIAASLRSYEGGPMTPVQRQAARDWLRHMNWTHVEFGNLIGISRQQVTNSPRARGSDGFGRTAAANMRQLLHIAA